jgi:hypothetical protein
MGKTGIWIGLVVGGLGAIAPGAIGHAQQTPALSMTDLSLPALQSPVPGGPAMTSQTVAEVMGNAPFTDISSAHWAYEAVNNLVTNYGCLSGYPDGTFRGDELVTRYEFAAAMDDCLSNVVQVIEAEPQVDLDQLLNQLTQLEQELDTLSDDVEAIPVDL